MGLTPSDNEVYRFLQSRDNPHGVISYIDSISSPSGALVAFSATKNLGIIFGTSVDSRKASAFKRDNCAAFTVANIASRQTVQLKGLVNQLTVDEVNQMEVDHYNKLGNDSARFRLLKDQRFYLISTYELMYSDCAEEPWTITWVRPRVN